MTAHIETNEAFRANVSEIDLHPFEVRVDNERRGQFDDLRDAIACAKLLRRDRPLSCITVLDASSSAFVIEVE